MPAVACCIISFYKSSRVTSDERRRRRIGSPKKNAARVPPCVQYDTVGTVRFARRHLRAFLLIHPLQHACMDMHFIRLIDLERKQNSSVCGSLLANEKEAQQQKYYYLSLYINL